MADGVDLGWTLRFVRAAANGRERVLEVGCGSGRLAARLAAEGHAVTALDRDLSGLLRARAAGVRFVEADFLRFDGGPFDALVFEASLHHVFPLGRAIDHAAALLAPDGVLVLDEFDRAACDEATAAFRYRREERLAVRRHHHGAHAEDPSPGETALARWRREHHHHPPLHTGKEMVAALRRRFAEVGAWTVPYLFRYAAEGLAGTPAGERAAAALLREEREAVEEGRIRAVGLRVVARRPRPSAGAASPPRGTARAGGSRRARR